jgi:hypothetical protein
VVTISISAEALSAIAATLPEGREADRRPDGKCGYSVTLPRAMLNRLKSLRGPGKSYRRRDPEACDGRLIFVKMVA